MEGLEELNRRVVETFLGKLKNRPMVSDLAGKALGHALDVSAQRGKELFHAALFVAIAVWLAKQK